MSEIFENDILELNEEALELVSGGKDYKVKANEVNVRSGPGKEFGVNGKLKKGDKVTYLKDKKKDKDGNTWLYVSNGNINGWIRSDKLK